MLLYLIMCVIIVSFISYYYYKTFSYWSSKHVRGPKPIPFFGNFKEVALRRKHVGMLYWDLYKKYPEEKVIGMYRMSSPTLLIRDLDIMKQILIKDFETFPDRGSFFSIAGLGQNIFHSDFETWKFLRNQFTSLYATTKLRGIFPYLATCGDKFVEYVRTTTKTRCEHDIYQLVLKYAVSSAMLAIFGLNIEIYNTENRLFDVIDEKFVNIYVNEVEMILPGLLTKFNLSVITGDVITFSHQIFNTARKHHSIYKNRIKNLIDVFQEFEKHQVEENKNSNRRLYMRVTDDLLAAQTWLFYVAGYGNNTLLLTYAMYHLACNPNMQEKLEQEITEVMSKHNGILNLDSVREMKYLKMIFYETLRMHPPTSAIMRSASHDIKLQGLDFTINKGTYIVMSPYAIQHDEKYYPEPEQFKPERFLTDIVKDRHTCAFLSFGTGPRGCLGAQFARLQFSVCLAKVISKFRVEVSAKTITKIDYNPIRVLLTPDQKILLNLVPR